MKQLSIGIIREGKIPNDKRTPFTPGQAATIQKDFPSITIHAQESKFRCFSDSEYHAQGIDVVSAVDNCDVLMGIKEVPVSALIPEKTYFFFSHTLKKQPHNRKLLQEILKKRITLIDYEALTDQHGKRLVAFGRFAGIVGAYNALLFYGRRTGQYRLKRAFQCFDIAELKHELQKVRLPAIKIVLTGSGRVGNGAIEILEAAGIRKTDPHPFLERTYDYPVYTQLSSADYHQRKDGGPFNREDFHKNPTLYTSTFVRFAHRTDILIAGAYWDPAAPVLFSERDMNAPDFRIKMIADISCDINGSIPSTKKPSSISDPVYDYNPETGKLEKPFSSDKAITVMAIDNLPCELPRDASTNFGADLIRHVIPRLTGPDEDKVLERATIAKAGKLTPWFAYLADYAN